MTFCEQNLCKSGQCNLSLYLKKIEVESSVACYLTDAENEWPANIVSSGPRGPIGTSARIDIANKLVPYKNSVCDLTTAITAT
jgi:hypothetical protein